MNLLLPEASLHGLFDFRNGRCELELLQEKESFGFLESLGKLVFFLTATLTFLF